MMSRTFRANVALLLAVVACTLLTSVARVFWKLAANRLPDIVTNWPLLAGFTLYGIAAIALLYMLKTGEVSVIMPIFATSYVWVALLSAYFFDESIAPLKWAGIALIVVGVIIVGTAQHTHETVIP